MENLFTFIKNIDSFALCLGILLGLFLLFLLMFCKIILRFIFKGQRKSNGINVSSEGGNIFISANAIADLVRSLETSYPELNFLKIMLLKGVHGKFVLDLQVSFKMKEKGLSEIITALQSNIKDELKKVFGIESINKINIKVKKTEMNSQG